MRTRAFRAELGFSMPPTEESQKAVIEVLGRVLPALDLALSQVIGYQLTDVFIGLEPVDATESTKPQEPRAYKAATPSGLN